jgi:hypothetical protein
MNEQKDYKQLEQYERDAQRRIDQARKEGQKTGEYAVWVILGLLFLIWLLSKLPPGGDGSF